jgi:hypothetical protein
MKGRRGGGVPSADAMPSNNPKIYINGTNGKKHCTQQMLNFAKFVIFHLISL